MADTETNASPLDAGLADAARAAGLGQVRIDACRRLSGGASKESWAFDLHRDGVCDPMVLRRAPAAARFDVAGTIGLDLEAKLIRLAEAAGVPVPTVAFELPSQSPLGEGFAMTRVDGESVGPRVLKSEALAAARPGLARQCGAILAKIHRMPVAELPELDAFTPAEAVEALRTRYRATGQDRPVFDWAVAWLLDHLPADAGPVALHGDFRNGNLIVGPDGVRAVLDWETAHIGHAAEDLGWLCVPSWRFGRPELPVGGFGTIEDLLAGYREAGGTAITPDQLRFWIAYGALRWGVMCAEVGMRFESEVRSVEGALIARRASETEFDLVQLIAPEEAVRAG